MTKLKIGFLYDDSLDKPDGVPQYVLTLGGWLTAQGHDVHYMVGQTDRTDVPNVHSLARNLHVRFNGNHLSIPLPARRRRLRQLLADEQFDIIHVQVPYSPFLAGRILRLLPPTTGVIGTFHVLPYGWVATWANRCLALLTRRTDRRFDAMISSTAPTQAFAKQVYGFTSTIIPHPITLANFRTPLAQTSIPTIVFLGRLVERKGARHLLEAINYLQTHNLFTGQFRVIIGGRGELLEKLQNFVNTHDLSEIVSFAGFVAEADKATFLSQADVAIFPSLSGESFGISLLEALATARGVVLGGDNPGYRAVLAPLSDDRLVRPNDQVAFAISLAWWLNDTAARAHASTDQKAYVQRFDIGIVGPQVVEIYNQALHLKRNVR